MLEEFKTYQNGDVQIILKRLFKKKNVCLKRNKFAHFLFFIFYIVFRETKLKETLFLVRKNLLLLF